MTYRYVIDKYGSIWVQWLFTKENYQFILPGKYHLDAMGMMRRRRSKRPFYLQARLQRPEGDYFEQKSMCY